MKMLMHYPEHLITLTKFSMENLSQKGGDVGPGPTLCVSSCMSKYKKKKEKEEERCALCSHVSVYMSEC